MFQGGARRAEDSLHTSISMLTPTQLLDIKISRLVNNLLLWNYKTAFKWSWIEFADIREYEQGDSFRSIDWITSAKQGKLYIKKYEEERQLTVLFLVDVGQTMLFGNTQSKQETLLETLYLLAFSALKNNDKIWALIYDEHILDFIPPAKNKANLIKIVNNISLSGRDGSKNRPSSISSISSTTSPYSNTLKALQYLTTTKQKNCLIFVLTDDMQKVEQKNIYKLASIKNEIIYINIFDTFENTLENTSKNTSQELSWEKGILNISPFSQRKKLKYQEQRKQETEQFKQLLTKSWIDYLQITEQSNLFKTFLSYFQSKT